MIEVLKRAIRRSAARLGYTIAADWRLARIPQQRYLSRLFELLAIDCVIDVGANRGQYRDFIRHDVNYSGHIISFEPVPALSADLRRRAQSDPAWIVEPYALGAVSGMARLNVMADDLFSSFRQPDHARTRRFERSNRVVEQVDVPVRTLDDVMPAMRARVAFHRPYLKIDTQGYDDEVLAGGPGFLAQTPALQFEASVVPIYEGAPNFAQSIRALEDAGFALSAIFPNNPEHFPRMIEFDCHMVRSTLSGDAG